MYIHIHFSVIRNNKHDEGFLSHSDAQLGSDVCEGCVLRVGEPSDAL